MYKMFKIYFFNILDLSLHTHSSNEEDSSNEDSRNEVDVEVDEETIIKYYFQRLSSIIFNVDSVMKKLFYYSLNAITMK